MSHQLDFQVTIWSDDKAALLRLEQWLNEMAIEPEDNKRLVTFTARLDYFIDVMNNLDIHSVDINWDEEDEDDTALETV